MNTTDLLDCLTHGTTHAQFLAEFNGDVQAAVEHLAAFYLDQLAAEGADAPGDEELAEMKRAAKRDLGK